MTRYWCIAHLHRLPEEIDLPASVLMRNMIAWTIVRERQANELPS